MKNYQLTINEEQAEVIAKALDLYSRLNAGQLKEVAYLPVIPLQHRLLIEDELHKLEPFVTGLPIGAHFGIYSPETAPQAKVAYDIYQVIRHRLAWDKNPSGGFQVDYDDPLKASEQPLPEII